METNGFKTAPDDLSGTISHKNENKTSKNYLEHIISIRIDLLPEIGEIQTLWLPRFAEGKFRFEKNEFNKICDYIYFWTEKDNWYLCAIRPAHLFDLDGNPCHAIKLLSKQNLIKVGNLDQNYRIYVQPITEKNLLFHNYQLCSSQDILIGSSNENDISYHTDLISEKHAVIFWEKSTFIIKRCNNVDDIWINGKKYTTKTLELGDVIYLFGLTIIVGTGFLSINDEIAGINIKKEKIRVIFSTQNMGFQPTNAYDSKNNKLFNRLPRKKINLNPRVIVVEAPPISLNSNAIPLILRMGGSMVIGGASALSGNYLMLLSSVLFPMLTQKYSDKEKKKYEERRLEKYRNYLSEKKLEIEKEKEYEEKIIKENYPNLNCVLAYSIDGKKLWERRKTDEDFLCIRVGYGDIPLLAKIEYPDQHFNMEVDILEQEMYELVKKTYYLKDVPIVVDFVQNFVCSIEGNKQLAFSFIKRVVMMMSILHSYDEMKIIFLAEEEDMRGSLEFIKYIPHIWDDQKSIRFFASEPSEALQISELIKRETELDIKKPRELKEILKQHPYYVIFALSKRIFDSMEILKELMQQEKTCGVSIITVFDDLPKECTLLLDLKSTGENSIIYLKETSRKDDIFRIDRFDKKLARKSMKYISNTYLKNITQTYSLPKVITFLEMYKAGKVEHLNVTKRWLENNPVKSLAVPVGVAADSSLFYLDLHQKYQGPHGLIAGTTGSGKSEFLLTYILSMAINFHPNEVSFVLIDYKGGGLAGAFDDPVKKIHLPHLIGTITNLDGASIRRSLLSIQSELIRRQRIFNATKRLSDEGTMDIYTYQKLYRNKIVSEPMPHLFIISDEFAELKQQQPDFMDKLISAARIGRSLGIHLILATQKPAGVVNEQIRSNTKFRICFKVQDKVDSQDMLERFEAVELKDTGRFYLQVGYNEYFAMGQSAWSGADYKPQDEVIVQQDESIQIIDSVGQSLVEVKPLMKYMATEGTQLVAIIKMLTELSRKQNISVRPLWKPELKNKIDLMELNNKEYMKEKISGILGVIDDPENQEQYNLKYNFEESQHLLIVGKAASGKTSLLQGVLFLLSARYTPKQLNYYILDYSSRMLKQFSKLPHCGAVLLEENVDELDYFFELINTIILNRKKLFLEIEVDNFQNAKEKIDLPLVLVIIDNVSGLSLSKKGEEYLYKLQNYLKNSINYGVKYIVTCNNLNDISYRLRQEFGDRICLHMKDKYEYGDALNCKVVYTPPELPGRGLYFFSEKPLEIQTAIYKVNLTNAERAESLERDILTIVEKNFNYDKAKGLPVISEEVKYDVFARQFSKGRIPLGFSKKNQKAVAMPLKQLSMLSVYQGNPVGKVPIVSNFLLAAKQEKMNIWFIKKSKNSYWKEYSANISRTYEKNVKIVSTKQEEVEELWHILAEEITSRVELRKRYCERENIDPNKEKIIEKTWNYIYKETESILVIFEDYMDFCRYLDSVSMIVFDKLFRAIKGLNIYIISFFEPNDSIEMNNNYLYSGFNPEENIMLFGGNFDKQNLVELPQNANIIQKRFPFNVCLMKYRGEYHVLLMPCGKIEIEEIDSDSQNIFK